MEANRWTDQEGRLSQRYYCPDPTREGRYHLPDDEARHLSRVCRGEPGDRVELFDGKGFATRAVIVEIGRNFAVLAADGQPIVSSPCPCALTLATAFPKGQRVDWLVEKATELGVSRLIPLLTEHSVVDPRDAKLERLRRTIIEASKQSKRNQLMVLDDPMSWADLVRTSQSGTRLLAQPNGLVLAHWPPLENQREIVLAVGPEGGFTAKEEALAIGAGWTPITLGPYVLRIETAGLAGAAAILSRFVGADPS
jgi:16S rRNA (uracil1498-N3)-methyltransferase